MASNLLKHPTPQQAFKIHPPSLTKTFFPSLPNHPQKHLQHQLHLSSFPSKPLNTSKIYSSSTQPSLSPYYPPKSKEEAILQAKTCLLTSLEKPLNNPRLTGKIKKLKQPRFRVEIPVIDDSSESLTQLALELFQDFPIRRKGTKTQPNITLLWPNPILTDLAQKAFSSPNQVENIDISSFTNDTIRILNSADVAVFLAPEASQVEDMKSITESLGAKPVVVFNPKWVFEDESEMGDLRSFVGSFEVVYSFLGLEVRGVFSKRQGVVFRCVRDGVFSGEKWVVLVEEEGGELKVVTKFSKRPSIGEVENVLYNLMAVNSPITKSAKFFRDLASNVTGKK